MNKKQRLELTWINKGILNKKIESRILIENTILSYPTLCQSKKDSVFSNRLIFGDNLLSLKALEQEFCNKIKCVFMNPHPIKGSNFKYEEHRFRYSEWLSSISNYLEITYNLLSKDGSLWILVDDEELYYLKIICDEIFGHVNFVANIAWRSTNRFLKSSNVLHHSHILVYRKSNSWRMTQGVMLQTIWDAKYADQFHNTEEEIMMTRDNSVATNRFLKPKPERLIQRILEVATNKDDLVLDLFADFGTTGAVAHKMQRHWIMIEQTELCHTYIIPRLKKVINGEDKGRITKLLNWKGGGSFHYFYLAPPLLERDKWENLIISKEYSSAMLAEALCKHEGFIYAPSDTFYWQHGYSTDRSFIYVVNQHFNHQQLANLADQVGEECHLLVLCKSFYADTSKLKNLTIEKISKRLSIF